MLLRMFLVSWLFAVPVRAEAPLVVFAAASLAGPLDAWAAAQTETITISYAGSATLARQIEAGAPADLVILANEAWMNYLGGSGSVWAESIRPILGNALVLAAPAGTTEAESLAAALSALPPSARIATGFTEAVPVGIYAREALVASDLWEEWAPRLVQTENARLALALVARGDVDRALVYSSDALAEPRVSVEVPVPSHLHTPIAYWAAQVEADARSTALLDSLTRAEAQARFAAAGFAPAP